MSKTIIYREGECSYVKNAINAVAEKLAVTISTDAAEKCASEIVIGDTSRDITAKAKAALLEKIEENKDNIMKNGAEEDDVTGFIIYAEGETLAVVWKDFQIAPLAINYLADNYSALSGEGVLYSDVFSIMDYLTEHERKLYEEKWARLEAKLPEKYRTDLIREMKLRLYCDNFFDAMRIIIYPTRRKSPPRRLNAIKLATK